jgi:2'-5' RNA ligase
MRLFVALSISADVRHQLASLLGELQGADGQPRWVNPANLHITLKFIGQVAAVELASIRQALAAVAPPPAFDLELRGIGFFPNDRRPAVVWAGIAAPSELGELAERIDHALSSCGIPREKRPFLAHLTLARLKETRLSPPLRAILEKSQDRSFGEMTAHEFLLMESTLKSTGAEYTTLDSFPFAAKGMDR